MSTIRPIIVALTAAAGGRRVQSARNERRARHARRAGYRGVLVATVPCGAPRAPAQLYVEHDAVVVARSAGIDRLRARRARRPRQRWRSARAAREHRPGARARRTRTPRTRTPADSRTARVHDEGRWRHRRGLRAGRVPAPAGRRRAAQGAARRRADAHRRAFRRDRDRALRAPRPFRVGGRHAVPRHGGGRCSRACACPRAAARASRLAIARPSSAWPDRRPRRGCCMPRRRRCGERHARGGAARDADRCVPARRERDGAARTQERARRDRSARGVSAEGYVLVVENGRTTLRPVTVGADVGGGRVEVLSGLASGERVARRPWSRAELP